MDLRSPGPMLPIWEPSPHNFYNLSMEGGEHRTTRVLGGGAQSPYIGKRPEEGGGKERQKWGGGGGMEGGEEIMGDERNHL